MPRLQPRDLSHWTYDTADRATNGGYTYDTLDRTLTVPDDDTAAGDGAGDVTNTFYTNDLARTVSQGSTTATYNLDVLTNRFRSYNVTTSGTTVSHTNHYSDDSDSPSWLTEGTWYTRPIAGLAGLAAQYTGASARLEWQITNLHGDIVAMRTAGATGVTATYITDEYGRAATSAPRYGYLGDAQRAADNPGGFILTGVRLYNPTTGRFLQTDPSTAAARMPTPTRQTPLICPISVAICGNRNGRPSPKQYSWHRISLPMPSATSTLSAPLF